MKRALLYVDLGGAAATIAALVLTVLLGVMPVLRLRRAQADRAVQLAEFNSQAETIEAEIIALRNRITTTAAEIENRKLTLLPPSKLNARIAGIIDSADAMGIEVLAIEPGELEHGEYYDQIPIDLRLTGPLPQFVRYLHMMRTDSADLIVQQFTIEARPGGGITADIRANWLTHTN